MASARFSQTMALKQSQTVYFPWYRQVDVLSSRKDSTLMDFISRDRGIETRDHKLSVGLYDELLATAKKIVITVKIDAQV